MIHKKTVDVVAELLKAGLEVRASAAVELLLSERHSRGRQGGREEARSASC